MYSNTTLYKWTRLIYENTYWNVIEVEQSWTHLTCTCKCIWVFRWFDSRQYPSNGTGLRAGNRACAFGSCATTPLECLDLTRSQFTALSPVIILNNILHRDNALTPSKFEIFFNYAATYTKFEHEINGFKVSLCDQLALVQ